MMNPNIPDAHMTNEMKMNQYDSKEGEEEKTENPKDKKEDDEKINKENTKTKERIGRKRNDIVYVYVYVISFLNMLHQTHIQEYDAVVKIPKR